MQRKLSIRIIASLILIGDVFALPVGEFHCEQLHGGIGICRRERDR